MPFNEFSQYEHKFQFLGFSETWTDVFIRGNLKEMNFLAFYNDEEDVKLIKKKSFKFYYL